MGLASYTNGNDIFTVNKIETYEPIERDSAEALSLVNYDVDSEEEYKLAMQESVNQRLAYEVIKNDTRVGYVYNRIVDGVYYGSCINVIGFEAMVIALKTMFEIHDSHKIVFKPHGGNLNLFKSLVLGQTIRAWHNGKETVSVMKDVVLSRGEKAFSYLGLKEL